MINSDHKVTQVLGGRWTWSCEPRSMVVTPVSHLSLLWVLRALRGGEHLLVLSVSLGKASWMQNTNERPLFHKQGKMPLKPQKYKASLVASFLNSHGVLTIPPFNSSLNKNY